LGTCEQLNFMIVPVIFPFKGHYPKSEYLRTGLLADTGMNLE